MRFAAGAAIATVAVVAGVLLLGAGEDARTPATAKAAAVPKDGQPLAPQQAAGSIQRRIGAPAVLPAGLPHGTQVSGKPRFHGRSASLTLKLPDERIVSIQYGRARFDGCGPSNPTAIDLAGTPAVMNKLRHRGRPYTEIVWPATLSRREGRYGVAGDLPRRRMVALATSMARKADEAEASVVRGC
jgi:hypothetical protein